MWTVHTATVGIIKEMMWKGSDIEERYENEPLPAQLGNLQSHQKELLIEELREIPARFPSVSQISLVNLT